MVDLPELSKKDVEDAMQGVASRDRKGRRLFAFHGRYAPGTSEVLSLDGGGSVHVVPVKSELDLRAQMPALGAASPMMAFILPWAGEVPLDLAGRFSRDGRIARIGKESRLRRILGATDLADGVLGSALAEHVLAHPTDLDGTTSPGGMVTLDALFERWLKARLGIDTAGGLALDHFLGWAAVETRTAAIDDLEAKSPAVVTAIEGHLQRILRDTGLVVWKAWRARRGRSLLELAVLFEALAAHEEGPAYTWRGMQQTELGVADDATARRVATELGGAVGRALRWIEGRDAAFARSVLVAAEARITATDVRPLLVSSKRLPVAWDLRLENLGRALELGAVTPGTDSLKRAADAYAQLDTHLSFTDPKHQAIARRAERAVQLLAWLASGSPAPEPSTETPHRDAENLGRWYVEEGAFVDRARRRARGPASDPFGKGVQAVVLAADAIRRALDRRFARSLEGWVKAGRPAGQVLPIDMAVERVALRFLQAEPSRKLLVLLMDGMGWSEAIALLDSVGAWTVPWGPIAWHSASEGRIGQAARPVIFAQLPTVTEVSRSAFFAGKPTPAGSSPSTSDDPKRWLDHKAVGKIEREGIAPRLLLRGEGHSNDGTASSEALSLVSDPSRRLVGIVINAIDASLKGDTQHRHEWAAENIASLGELLDKAREAGRAILLAADHGHVPGDLLTSKGTYTGASARYRPWADAADPIAEDEVGFSGTGVWAPKGAHGIIALSDDQSRYGGGAHAGEHGGASLAEVIAPCLLLAPDDGREIQDAMQRITRLVEPAWWHLDVEPLAPTEGESVDVPPPRPRPSKKGRPTPKEQLALTPVIAPVAAVDPSPPASPPRIPTPPPRRISSGTIRKPSPLEQSDIFRARTPNETERKRVLFAVQYLSERGDTAHVDAFCAAIGEPAWRAPGLVRTLQQALNVDGYEAITHDLRAKQVRLQRAVLEAQFGVKL